MRFLREHLLVQFVLVRLLVLVMMVGFLGLGLSWVASRTLNQQIVRLAVQGVEQDVAPRVRAVLTPQDFQAPMQGAKYETFDSFIRANVASSLTARIKLWNREGTVLYADDQAQVGQSYPIKENLARVLAGETATEVSVPQAAENQRERLLGTLIEVYVPVAFPEAGIVGAFEVYEFYAPLKAMVDDVRRIAFLSIVGGIVLLYLALAYVFVQGWDMVRQQQRTTQARLRELQALNNLFRSYLSRDQEIMAQVQRLQKEAEASLTATWPQELEAAHQRLVTLVVELARQAKAASPPPEDK